jgi:hypothetical protein
MFSSFGSSKKPVPAVLKSCQVGVTEFCVFHAMLLGSIDKYLCNLE